jgi:phosphoglycerate dehydrogenase-like enzyme
MQEPTEWHLTWMLAVERRLTRIEMHLGKRTTEKTETSQGWSARDTMMAIAGIGMVLATLAEKAGLTAVFSTLLAAYGSK